MQGIARNRRARVSPVTAVIPSFKSRATFDGSNAAVTVAETVPAE